VYEPEHDALTFHVLGTATPQGSGRVIRGVLITKTPALSYWRSQVAERGERAMLDAGLDTLDGPIGVGLVFRLPMPATRPAWQRALGQLPAWRRPDLDKLERAVLDGLTDGGVYRDDGQVTRLTATKDEHAVGWLGVSVTVWRVPMPEQPPRGRRPSAPRVLP